VNNSISKRSLDVFQYIDKCSSKFNTTKSFFFDILGLYIVALENLIEERTEDAFLYYFKITEKVSKHYYLSYMKRHNTKIANKNKKSDLKKIIKQYAKDKFFIQVTEDMLTTKTDSLYKFLKEEFYGSLFNKISLIITKECIPINLDEVSKLVKTRNK
jgi:hypothetical protein